MTCSDSLNQRSRPPCQPIERLARPTNVTTVLTAPAEGAAIESRADAALERLYEEHYVRLVRLSVLLLGDVGRAEEVVQDAFVAMHQRWSTLEGANLPAYLRQSVVNRSRSSLRHLRVVDRHPPEAPLAAPGADEPLLTDSRRRSVIEALAALPRRQREVLVLRHYLDLSEREIADTLAISPGSVKTHASRGSAALRAALSGLQEDQ
jgi:RNA polymerase sigma-70 factor (sigma-E family)